MTAARRPVVSIVVTVMRDVARLRRCLDAIAAAATGIEHELVLALSGADDEVLAFAREGDHGARVVGSRVNLGFAGALNLGRRHALGRYLAIVQDDARVGEGWPSGLLKALETHPGAGLAGARVVSSERAVDFCGALLDAALEPLLVPGGAVSGPVAVDYCSSAAVVVRAEAWDAAGGADEELFPAGCVDIDLAMRMRRAGWDVIAVPDVIVDHPTGASSGHGWRLWTARRNRDRCLEIWADELAGHEQPGASEGRLDRGLARAATRSAALAARRWPEAAPEAPDDPAQAERASRRELALLRDYVAFADAELEAARAEARTTAHRLDALHEEAARGARAFEKRIRALERSGRSD